jgi:hypothetical protein
VPELAPASPTFWNWLAPKGVAPKKRPQKQGKAVSYLSTMDDGSIVLGTLELKATILELHVNSASRAERGRAMLEALLDGLVGMPLMERQTIEQALAEQDESGETPTSSGLTPEEERQLIHSSMDDHYRRQLDEPLPALGNKSPREAARSKPGREKLVAWLKLLENHAATINPDGPMGSYDLSWLWHELNVAHLRK